MPDPQSVILASTSQSRRSMLKAAGIAFIAEAADIDERQVEAAMPDLGVKGVAAALAEAKAAAVSARHPGALVIGADQTLGLGDRAFHKPASPAAARDQLIALRGGTHQLHSAVCCVRDGRPVFHHVATAQMTMRRFSDDWLDWYMATAGDAVLASVGCYQVEGPGIQLFEAIDGDYFTIIGLPLLPLLAALREQGVLHD